MGQINKIFKVKEPIVHNFSTPQRQSAEAVEDYAVKKVVATQELYANVISGDINASKINGTDVSFVEPSEGKILVYRAASSAFVLEDKPIDTTDTNATKLQDVNITETAPSDGKLLVYRAASTAYVLEDKPVDASAPEWGDILGTLSEQTDLNTALDGKVATATFNTLSNEFDTHIASTSIHYLESSIDHTHITNVGSNTHAQLDTHVGSAAIHFTEASIDHTHLSNIGTNTHAQLDTHVASSAIHFTEASISHTNISDIGTNTHAQLDTHVASSAIHYTEGSIDHTAINNIGTNSHSDIDLHIASTAIHFVQGSISIPASQVSDFDTEVSNNTTVAAVVASTHAQGTDTTLGSGAVALDHGAAATDMIINVCYGTSATPPTANTTTEGTIYVQYTA